MLNLIRAEIYKTEKRNYTKIFVLVFIALALLMNIFLKVSASWNDSQVYRGDLFRVYTMLVMAPMFLFVATADIVFSDEYKHSTMKNVVAFGYTRTQIYFSKLITAIINSFAIALLVSLVLVGSCFILFPGQSGDGQELLTFVKAWIYSAPLWLSQIALCIALWTNIKSSTAATILVFLISWILPQILQIVSLITQNSIYNDIGEKFPMPQFSALMNLPDSSMIDTLAGRFSLIGFGFSAGFIILGWLIFAKREIK